MKAINLRESPGAHKVPKTKKPFATRQYDDSSKYLIRSQTNVSGPIKSSTRRDKQIRRIKGALPEEYTKDSSRFLRTVEMVLH